MALVSLEKAFLAACSQHENSMLIDSQWRFNKPSISKALLRITENSSFA